MTSTNNLSLTSIRDSKKHANGFKYNAFKAVANPKNCNKPKNCNNPSMSELKTSSKGT